ncbi:hypothetical protein KUTeg_018589 [Tegillarca granosa]|uniref:RAVE complex protein Rav1 C-terminal domain-containing protein n=1 Tax=Tegillarca granosa TaxID=220873 RepID=A0ABQ9EMA0_TEGGR|nr:hypothetical protein KUTeg_018589 [Tegillarca granosa]
MNRHQVLTGACNSGDQCYAVGSVEGIHFTAYAAGCDIVILASDFQRVQIIPGVTHGNVKVNCLDCSTDTGKIAASYQSKVYIFEPTPLLHHESTHKLDYHWYQTATIEAECFINCLSWNLEGAKLLTGGDLIQIWQLGHEFVDEVAQRNVKFSVGHDDDDKSHTVNQSSVPDHSELHTETQAIWDCIWKCRPATSVYHLKFSPDGLLFASAGKADRLVKIWYEDRKVQLHPLCRTDSIVSPKKEELHYSFVYIAHPRAVTGFSWRKTSKYMPRGSVANMLVTSCIDNVCRLWCETILPDDGLVDLEQFDPNATLDPKFHSHRHKKRFIQRLKTIRHAIHKRRKHTKFGPDTIMSMPNFSTVNSVASVHDFHKFSIHNNGICPALHFHLAASINPETDIPLLPVVGSKGDLQHNFQLHWLNNKELQFTMEAESILQDLHRGTLYEDSHKDSHSDSQDFLGSDSDHSPEHSNLGVADDHTDSDDEPHECEHGEDCPRNGFNETSGHERDNTGVGGIEFCSELILWRVDPVGPLSKSGGIVELARINSPTLSAFENVAWVPTLLPSNTSSGYSVETPKAPGELFNIVSLQSSSRPGCIIELESIADAKDWQQTQLLHVFQDQMVTGKPGMNAANMEACVDLRNTGSFSEHFYLVLLEKNKEGGSTLHMWKITISSQPGAQVEDYNLIEDDGSNPPSRSGTPEPVLQKPTAIVKLMFSATKVVSQKLPLPDNVEVLCATVAAGHLSSASIYPACLAPYLIVTACSDGEVRFWTCDVSMVDMGPESGLSHVSLSTTSFEVIVEEEDSVRKPTVSHFTHSQMSDVTFAWREWKMLTQTQTSSSIKISGHPITIKCAYSGRVACGYRLGAVRATQENPSNKFVNLYVAIYECESTADGLPPLPMHMSWVRAGILVVGMDNEMHVYSQWRGSSNDVTTSELEKDKRCLDEATHLVRCIAGGNIHHAVVVGEMDVDESKLGMGRQRGISISGGSPGDIPTLSEDPIPDYKEISSIPPLPIYALLAADEDTVVSNVDVVSTQTAQNASQDYTELFDIGNVRDEELDLNVFSSSAESRSSQRQRMPSSSTAPYQNPNHFDARLSHLLMKHLTHAQLPGLSSLDQMYLLALADTVAKTKTDFADHFESDSKPGMHTTESMAAVNPTAESIDDCGLRFLLAIRHHIYLIRTLPPGQRVMLQQQGIKTSNIVWAFHSEATEVCLDKLHDVQLAIVISRLYAGDEVMPESVKKILYTHVLGCDENGGNYDLHKAHPDPFLRSMALWLLKDHRESLNTLLWEATGQIESENNELEEIQLPSVFNFYNYLRTHPLLVRQIMASAAPKLRRQSVIAGFTRQQTIAMDDKSVCVDKVTPIERRLFFITAHNHFKNGCPLLALEVLSKLPPVTEECPKEKTSNDSERLNHTDSCITTGTIGSIDSSKQINSNDTTGSFDWSQPVTSNKETADSIDWSSPLTNGDTTSSLDWGTPISRFDLDDPRPDFKLSSDEEEEGEDDHIGELVSVKKPKLKKIPTITVEDAIEVEKQDELEKQEEENKTHLSKTPAVDIFAQQYTFIACLKVLMEEMHTLATGFEVDGGQLRFQLYIWLEREVEALQYLCNYGRGSDDQNNPILQTSEVNGDSSMDDSAFETPSSKLSGSYSNRSTSSGTKATLHEVILAEKMDFEANHNFHSNTHTGHLMAGVQRYRRRSSVGDNMINTAPSKWPGVTSLRVLIAREKDEDSQKLNILLSETLIAVYASLLVNALATYDCHMLYRLVAHRFEQQMWSAFFGGGVKTVVKPSTGNSPLPMKPGGDDLSKQRMKLHMKVIGSGGGGKDRTTYKESFVPPEISMVTFFMTKPFQIMADTEFSYDSEESLTSDEEDEDEDEDDTFRPTTLPLSTVQQHTDPTSYSWCLIRYSVVKLVLHNLQAFLPQVGIELPELPVCSPLMHAVFKILEQWMEVLKRKLELFAGPPEEYIAGLHLDVVNGVPISKYKALLHPSNSPFV